MGCLGRRALPIEVLPFTCAFVARQVDFLGATVASRMAAGRHYRTDQDNYILDCAFGPNADLVALAVELSFVAGLLGHDLFLTEIDVAYVGSSEGVKRINASG